MCSSRGFVFGSVRFPQAAKSALPFKSKIEAKIAKFATRKICAFFRLGPCGRSSAVGAPGPHRGAGGLVVLRPSLKRVVPGSVPPWRFAWPCRGFGLPGVFSCLRRGFLLPAARNCGAASEVASRSAIARFFPYYSSRYKNLLLKLFPESRDKQLRPTT